MLSHLLTQLIYFPQFHSLPIYRGANLGAQGGGGGGGQIATLPQSLQVGVPLPSADGSMKPSDVKEMMFRFIRDFHVGTIHVYR